MSARTSRVIRRVLAMMVGAALASVAVVALRPQPVDAAFTDTQYGKGNVAAATLPTPEFTSCTYTSANVTINWQFDSNPLAIPASEVEFTVHSDLLGGITQTLAGSSVTTTQVATDQFTTTIATNVISGLVGAVLSTFNVTAKTGVSGWTSPTSRPANATHFLLSPYTCDIG